MSDEPHEENPPASTGRVLSVHIGHSANCSSVGSVVDFLFVSAVTGAALIAAFEILVRDSPNKSAQEEE